ncbi:hypothetical protein E8E15_009720 [Penicillium rubens]|jgi:hypothetical protein|uniref:Pc13g09000 protein n=2 Tax=Penicillium chrysogenum species complex TaxID=254878 RepID=B6H4J0_PENRW|nr:uncharacterized protein N7525_003274 [Penicillium rubens]KZN93102.1 Coiled-coil domain-containing protein [Penicillium chrysogenum]CAP91969.1 Pc13g09000 [Penicillium rubens Wisconsin 54-1255]KAF3030631.1 hypothetical protein E8E15_009720 [Penicillium rubens]KAJ5045841.1 hypothetical protein NUH16_002661 [Penicillium rubens]KAJ5838086.1 hypothetical protein N7525_003274 [Penicillium rubens]
MPADQDSLYGQPRSKKIKTEQTTSSNLAFTSQLSSLIAQDAASAPSRGRHRPSKDSKSDIFSKHNKGTQKRAAADLADDNRAVKQVHRSTQDIGSVDANTLGRSRRRMQEKARLYDDMKKGLHLVGDSDDDDMPVDPSDPDAYLARLRRKEKDVLVDFDLKHANEEAVEQDESDDDNASIISYEDEFGRSRRGTRREAAEASRAKDEEAGARAAQERWRPARPDNLIYGETVQTEAFNPDAKIATHMSNLAARRDRSPTPPENKHYNAETEVRNRGTGFYNFSTDEEERKQQMEELRILREETILKRKTDEERMAERNAHIEWRLKEIQRLSDEYKEKRRLEDLEAERNPKPKATPPPKPPPTRLLYPENPTPYDWTTCPLARRYIAMVYPPYDIDDSVKDKDTTKEEKEETFLGYFP